jgi:hypothetical protein
VKKKAPTDLAKSSYRAFHRSVDWPEWWGEFYKTVGPDGLPLYRTVRKYVQLKATSSLQKDFLYFYLGSKDTDQELYQKYTPFTPQDWDEKREMGMSRAITEVSKQFQSKQNALEALREAGHGVTLRAFYSLNLLNEKLDKTFAGELFVPGKTEADNYKRAHEYVDLKAKMLHMIGEAQEYVARSLGINFDNMEGFASLLSASVANQAASTAAANKLSNVLDELHTMVLLKKQAYPNHIDLPVEIESKLIEASSPTKQRPQ